MPLFFFAHGFIPSVRHAINDPGTIPLVDPLSLHPVNRASLGETECVILQVMPAKDNSELHDELWVQQEGGRILRKDLWAGRVLLSRVDVNYKGAFPSNWIATEFSQDKLTLEQRFSVKEIELNPQLDPTLFDIKLKPGLRLRKIDANNLSDDKEYLVGDDGKTLIEWEKRGPNRRPLLPFVLLSIIITGVVFSVLCVLRRWKSRKRIVPACGGRTVSDTPCPEKQ